VVGQKCRFTAILNFMGIILWFNLDEPVISRGAMEAKFNTRIPIYPINGNKMWNFQLV